MTIRLVLIAAALFGLAACGRQGELEQPAPLFGERARAAYEAERARGAAPDETSTEENEQDRRQRSLPSSTGELPPPPTPQAPAATQPAQPPR